MIKKLKPVSDEKIRLLSNFFSLSVLQGANYLLPLITLPYLVRVLGPAKFGLIAFAHAFIQYFIVLTDYGFNLSATKEISIHREDREKLSEIFSSVILIKFALMILSFALLSILVFSFNKFRIEWQVYFLTFGMVIGQVLFPVWFFQGIERMRHIAVLNIFAKLFFTLFIFIVIKHKSDYMYVPLLNSLGFIIAGIIGLWVALRHFKVKVKVPPFIAIKQELKNGWHIFISKIAISVYTTSNTVILGLFTNNTVVGYYAAGEKIVRAIQGLQIPLSQSMYPYISKLVTQSKEAALSFIAKITKIVGVSTFLMSLTLFVLASQVSKIVLGGEFKISIQVIRILSFLPFVIGLSNIFGVQVMLNFGLKKTFSKILTTGSILDIILALMLVAPLQHIGISISVLLTEIFVTTSMFVFLQRNGLGILQHKAYYQVAE